MIDWNRVTQLRDEIGEDDFAEIVSLFLEEVDEAIERLATGFNPDTLSAELHFLKGSALNLGFRQFAGLCQTGESASRDPATDAALVDQVVASYAASRAAFLDRMGKPLPQIG